MSRTPEDMASRGSEMATVVPRPGAVSTSIVPAVLLDDPVDDREAEPGAAREAVGEGREQAVALLVRHAVPLVGEGDLPERALERRVTVRTPPPGMAATALRATFQKIWRSWPGSAGRTNESGAVLHVDRVPRRDLVRVREEREDVAERGGRVDGLEGALLRADVPQEVLEDRAQAVRLGDDDLHEAVLRGVDRHGALQRLDGARDGREGVADLVRDAGRELADGRELVLEPHLALEPFDVRDVLEDQDAADRVARAVPQRRRRDAEVRLLARGCAGSSRSAGSPSPRPRSAATRSPRRGRGSATGRPTRSTEPTPRSSWAARFANVTSPSGSVVRTPEDIEPRTDVCSACRRAISDLRRSRSVRVSRSLSDEYETRSAVTTNAPACSAA